MNFSASRPTQTYSQYYEHRHKLRSWSEKAKIMAKKTEDYGLKKRRLWPKAKIMPQKSEVYGLIVHVFIRSEMAKIMPWPISQELLPSEGS